MEQQNFLNRIKIASQKICTPQERSRREVKLHTYMLAARMWRTVVRFEEEEQERLSQLSELPESIDDLDDDDDESLDMMDSTHDAPTLDEAVTAPIDFILGIHTVDTHQTTVTHDDSTTPASSQAPSNETAYASWSDTASAESNETAWTVSSDTAAAESSNTAPTAFSDFAAASTNETAPTASSTKIQTPPDRPPRDCPKKRQLECESDEEEEDSLPCPKRLCMSRLSQKKKPAKSTFEIVTLFSISQAPSTPVPVPAPVTVDAATQTSVPEIVPFQRKRSRGRHEEEDELTPPSSDSAEDDGAEAIPRRQPKIASIRRKRSRDNLEDEDDVQSDADSSEDEITPKRSKSQRAKDGERRSHTSTAPAPQSPKLLSG